MACVRCCGHALKRRGLGTGESDVSIMLLNSSLSDVHLAAFTGNLQCYHSYDYRPNWTPLSLLTITYNEKFPTKYCKKQVPTILKVLVSLNFVRTPLRLISACQEMILSFCSRRTTFPRFNSVPVRKPKNILQLENLLSQ